MTGHWPGHTIPSSSSRASSSASTPATRDREGSASFKTQFRNADVISTRDGPIGNDGAHVVFGAARIRLPPPQSFDDDGARPLARSRFADFVVKAFVAHAFETLVAVCVARAGRTKDGADRDRDAHV